MKVDSSKVCRCAIELEDTALLAKLERLDMIALEAKYHRKCFIDLYNRAGVLESTVCDAHLHGIAFAGLVSWKTFEKKTLHLSSN